MCEQSDAQLIHDNIKWPKNFDQKGIISVRKDTSFPPFNNLKEAKMTVSAQLVTEEFDPEGILFWKFYCDPSDLHRVKRYLIERNCEIEEAFVGYIPKREILVPNHVKNAARKLIVELNKIPTVDNVYTNIM
ncbi:hypothetical protein HNY73_000651 [Argiope bruennichi]|nr:hypothetical protein HNY73_000651 [Argiope bruennichi]